MEEINLYHLLKYYVRHSIDIIIFTLLGLAFGFVYNNYIQVPMYKSNATLLVVGQASSQSQETTQINNYIELYKSRRVLGPVIEKQQLPMSYEDLVKTVTASNAKDTGVIKVSIVADNPSTSKVLLESSLESFKNEAKALYGQDNIQLVDGASQPNLPYNVKKSFQLALGALGGFTIALVGLFLIYDYNQSKNTKLLNGAEDTRSIHSVGILGHNKQLIQSIGSAFSRDSKINPQKKPATVSLDTSRPPATKSKAQSKTKVTKSKKKK